MSVLLSLCGQAAAQCWYETEAAGSMVLAGSVLLPAPQAVHPGRHGGSGKPRVQQQEDRTYPHSSPVFLFYPTLHNTIQDPLVTVCSDRLVSAHVYQDCLIWMIIQRFYELPPLWGCKKTHTHLRIMYNKQRFEILVPIMQALWRPSPSLQSPAVSSWCVIILDDAVSCEVQTCHPNTCLLQATGIECPLHTCSHSFLCLTLTEFQENCRWRQFRLCLRNWGKKVGVVPSTCLCGVEIRDKFLILTRVNTF